MRSSHQNIILLGCSIASLDIEVELAYATWTEWDSLSFACLLRQVWKAVVLIAQRVDAEQGSTRGCNGSEDWGVWLKARCFSLTAFRFEITRDSMLHTFTWKIAR